MNVKLGKYMTAYPVSNGRREAAEMREQLQRLTKAMDDDRNKALADLHRQAQNKLKIAGAPDELVNALGRLAKLREDLIK
jgi:hypothetical protein